MSALVGVSRTDQMRALGLSTFAFTVCFAVWTIFSIIGVKIKGELGLNDTQFEEMPPALTHTLHCVWRQLMVPKHWLGITKLAA